jgi:molybdenum cofactor cytidylyltransferase
MNGVQPPHLQCVVLAAGRSTRLGRPKALLRIHGLSLLRRTVRLLRGLGAGPVIVVVPPRAQRLRAELAGEAARCVENRHRDRGLSSSVQRGLDAARFTRAVLLVPVDLVHLQRRDLERLVARARAHPREVVARRLGAGPATPLIFPQRLRKRARALQGDQGLRELFARVPREAFVTLELPSASADLDTRDDLPTARSFRALAARGRYPSVR